MRENKPNQTDLSSVQSKARWVWPHLQLPQVGPCPTVQRRELEAVSSPPRAAVRQGSRYGGAMC